MVGVSKVVETQTGFAYQPTTVLNAQMSMRYDVAVAMLDGQAYLEQFTDERLQDPVLNDAHLARRYRDRPGDGRGLPAALRRQGHVRHARRPAHHQARRLTHAAMPENPMDEAEVKRKFLSLAAAARAPTGRRRSCAGRSGAAGGIGASARRGARPRGDRRMTRHAAGTAGQPRADTPQEPRGDGADGHQLQHHRRLLDGARLAYYAERARGGVGMIMTEAMVVTENARPHHNSLCVLPRPLHPGLASLVEAIKAHDCHVFAQSEPPRALLRRSVLDMEPVGPSTGVNPNTGDAVRALSVPEIHEIQRLFVAAARRLWRAGYDGVEIHAANGYLFQQFFSLRFNKRTDQYGGSLENRMRLLLETVAQVRDALPDLILVVRLSASEFTPGGYSQAEIIELAQALERAGVAAIDLSGGSNESPQLSKHCIQPPSYPRGCLPRRQADQAGAGIPVSSPGASSSPRTRRRVLASGSADFISLGRALYADPHWCLKAFGEVKAPSASASRATSASSASRSRRTSPASTTR
jgi:2,4-dienoyl-CoA reductase-like NADH-dependent reductase (Old Yellow Enzyme family)